MIEIFYNFTFLNEFILAERSNKFKAAKVKRETTYAISLMLRGKKINTPTRLKFTWMIPNKRRDLDNISFAKKYILDSMVKAKVIPNDNLKHITGFQDEFEISDKVGVKIEVIE